MPNDNPLQGLYDWWSNLLERIRASNRAPELNAGSSSRLRVDILPDSRSFARGETVSGTILLRSGTGDHTVRAIALNVTNVRADRETAWFSVHLLDKLELKSGEIRSIPYSFVMPDEMPLSEDEQGVGRIAEGCRLGLRF